MKLQIKLFPKSFSTLSKISLKDYLNGSLNENEIKDLSNKVTNSFHKTGLLIVEDPRADFSLNQKFIQLFQQYFSSRELMTSNGNSIPECFPHHGYRTGITPEFTEKAKSHSNFISKLSSENMTQTLLDNKSKDAKWRYLLRVGNKISAYNSKVDPERIGPHDFPSFIPICDQWGLTLLDTIHSLSSLLEIGLNFPSNTLNNLLKGGISVVGPTGSNLLRYPESTVLAALHYDISFLSIHGKSNYPGLSVWTRNGTKISVTIPDNCFLVQAGKEIEYLTGGYIEAGLHEVILTPQSKAIAEKVNNPLEAWRVSSTLFSHIHPKSVLEPLYSFATKENFQKYPSTTGEEYTIKEFSDIGLIDLSDLNK